MAHSCHCLWALPLGTEGSCIFLLAHKTNKWGQVATNLGRAGGGLHLQDAAEVAGMYDRSQERMYRLNQGELNTINKLNGGEFIDLGALSCEIGFHILTRILEDRLPTEMEMPEVSWQKVEGRFKKPREVVML